MEPKPLAFIDVDGVLNRYELSNSAAKKRGLLSVSIEPSSMFQRFRMHLDFADADRLRSLEDIFDLAWGTTWEHDANLLIAPRIRFRTDLPVATTKLSEVSKAPGVVRLAAGRPFVWFDDDETLDEHLAMMVETSELTQPYHLIGIDPSIGLSDEHIEEARAWANSLNSTTS